MKPRNRWLLALFLLCGGAVDAWPAIALPVETGLAATMSRPAAKEKLVVQLAVIADAAANYRNPNPALQAMVQAALRNTGSQIVATADGTAYVKTGDIPAEWLRDSSVQVEATYLGYASDPQVRTLFRAVIQRQAKYLLVDPHANAFRQD